jgi:hypothetical protein
VGTKNLAAYDAKYNNGLLTPFQFAGTPTSGAGGTFASRAAVGSQLIDTAAGKYYICTAATGSSVTWTLVGSQT